MVATQRSSAAILIRPATKPGPTLPLDLQRLILLKALERLSHYCPKDNSVGNRESSRQLARASLVSREWQAFCYPLPTRPLPRASHLACFARTLDAQPQLGLWTTYFHYFGQVLPADFLARVFYRMPALKHFLTQADVTQILDEDIDPARPRPKLLTLEVDPGLHGGYGHYVDARVTRWADLSEIQSLALVGVEAPNNVLLEPLVNLQELHLLHFEDDLDPSPDAHHLILSILSKVGPQLRTLRIDEYSSEILLAPVEIFSFCPNLLTLSVSGLNLEPLLARGHSKLQHLLLGAPWAYHTMIMEQGYGTDLIDGAAKHELADEDRTMLRTVLDRADKHLFPAMKAVVLWNVSFDEAHNRQDREIKHFCDSLQKRFGWMVGDRFATGRDPCWDANDDFAACRRAGMLST